jgi:hypothetical protein
MEQLTVVSGLYRLALNPARQFQVRDLTVSATDLTLEMPAGQAFVAEIPEGPTAIVLLGRGRMRFAPSDPAERTQVRIFSGDDVLATDFTAVFLRVRPSEFSRLFAPSLVPRAVSRNDLRKATEVFDDYVGETLRLDLTDFSRERWSLIPTVGDFIAEVKTRRMGSLTYARSTKDAEDITLFDRKRRRNIAVYASRQKLAVRGQFYNEDDLVDYDVLRYDLDADFTPDRGWVDGNARIKVKIRASSLTALTLRLADSLVVRSVMSPGFGRLLHLRVVGQNGVIVNFPSPVARDTELWLNLVYGGRIEPQQIDREGIAVSQQPVVQEFYIPIEPQFIYSNRSYWYPQSTVTDYATASLRLSVPADMDVVATGTVTGPPGPAPGPVPGGGRARKQFVFLADEPVRYLACVISRFTPVSTTQVLIPPRGSAITAADAGESGEGTAGGAWATTTPDKKDGGTIVTIDVQANPRQEGRARSLGERAASIIAFYGAILGDAPYPSFTLAVTENDLPGGHSPPYFALLHQPLPMSPLVWRNDPVAFDGYPPYFLAHEIAHQWWGQAIGWKNYHEQWLSEGFSQYFAALYAADERGSDTFVSMLRQMGRWAAGESDQGPVYLGYRLGHIKGDSRVFRALVYNKGAMVLHMLRRLVGEEPFFAGLRDYYREWKFRKAGTDDFRRVMERVTGRDLAPFFNGWVYASSVPTLRFTTTIGESSAVVRFEHEGELVPVPVTVTIYYADGQTDDVVFEVAEKVVERTLPLKGRVRSIEANRDYAAVADIKK